MPQLFQPSAFGIVSAYDLLVCEEPFTMSDDEPTFDLPLADEVDHDAVTVVK